MSHLTHKPTTSFSLSIANINSVCTTMVDLSCRVHVHTKNTRPYLLIPDISRLGDQQTTIMLFSFWSLKQTTTILFSFWSKLTPNNSIAF